MHEPKKKIIVGIIAIILTISIAIVIAYYFPDSVVNILTLRAQTDHQGTGNSNMEMNEFTGESFIKDSQIYPDDRTRTAALVDAIRQYGYHQQNKDRNTVIENEAYNSMMVWRGFNISVKSIDKFGIITNEEIRIVSASSNKNTQDKQWIVKNKKLFSSSEPESEMLKALTDILAINGAELSGGNRLGRSIWQEKVYFPQSVD